MTFRELIDELHRYVYGEAGDAIADVRIVKIAELLEELRNAP